MKNKILIIVLGFSFLQFSNVLSADLKQHADLKQKRESAPIVLFGPDGLSETIKQLQNALSKAKKAEQDGQKDDLEKYIEDAQNRIDKLLAIDQEAIAQKVKNTKHFREFLIQHGLLDKKFLDNGNDTAVDDLQDKFQALTKEVSDLWASKWRDQFDLPKPPQQPAAAPVAFALVGPGSLSEVIQGLRDSLSKAEVSKNRDDFDKFEKYMNAFNKLVPDNQIKSFEDKIKSTAHFRQFLIQHNLMTNEFLNSNDDQAVQNFISKMKELNDRYHALENDPGLIPQPYAAPNPVQPQPGPDVQPRQAQSQPDVKMLDEYKKRIPELSKTIEDVSVFRYLMASVKQQVISSIQNVIQAINKNDKDVAEKLALFDNFKKVLYSREKPDEKSLRDVIAKLNQDV